MKKIAVLALTLLPWAVSAEPAPTFSLPGHQGTVTLSELKGKVVYLDFWASWCTPCRQSFPWMNEIQKQYGSQGLVVVAVNVDQEAGQAKRFLEANRSEFTVAYDPEGKVAEAYRVQGMPSSYVIDRNGEVKLRHVGFREKDTEELERAMRELLANP